MTVLGRRNTLPVVRTAPPGAYLDGGELGQILLPARYVFTASRRIKLPVAEPGTTCDGKAEVRKTELVVRTGFREVGIDRSPIMVLARSPYLSIDERVRCLRIPA